MISKDKIILALPRGRILEEVLPVVERAGVVPEAAFFDDGARQLRFATNRDVIDVIRVRGFDMATFLAYGAADIGIVGSDVLAEFDLREVYAPLDLGVGRCRMVVAEPVDMVARDDPRRWSHINVATKYPETTRRHFAARGVHAECIRLNGAIEIAPALGLCQRIVDLTASGATLRANGLVEVEEIAAVSSRLAVNRTAFKTRPRDIGDCIERFREAVDAVAA